MLEAVSKTFFHLLAGSGTLQRLASRVGMRRPSSFARRFIAGETIEDAIAAARAVEARGLMITLDHLGENISTLAEAETATREYLAMIAAIVDSSIGRNLSLKLTQLGLDVDRARAVDNLRTILEHGAAANFFVRLDMESSRYTDLTLDIFEALWNEGYRSSGVVLQAALRRSEQDLRRVIALGGRVRLVKGAYTEPRSIAYPRKADVDAAFARMMKTLILEGHYPAIATHDETMIELTQRWAAGHGVGPDRFEFQMLYGVRRDLQSSLVKAGYRVRVYIPFGRQWFPYFMRRLGERPANVAFILRSLLREDW
ncbi:MAG: proline dehydrogenase family protein [Acidobacteriota bacterium]